MRKDYRVAKDNDAKAIIDKFLADVRKVYAEKGEVYLTLADKVIKNE